MNTDNRDRQEDTDNKIKTTEERQRETNNRCYTTGTDNMNRKEETDKRIQTTWTHNKIETAGSRQQCGQQGQTTRINNREKQKGQTMA